MSTLRSAIFRHDNDYGRHPLAALAHVHALSVCAVVPYYETGRLGSAAVDHLIGSLANYQASFATPPDVGVVVVDDGSVERPFRAVSDHPMLTVERLDQNLGRSAVRNVGLRLAAQSGYDMVVFVDSDIVVAPDQIEQIARLWSRRQRTAGVDEAIVANLFTTLTRQCDPDSLSSVLDSARIETDWRWWCRYQSSWIGCPGDIMYVGEQFRLVDQTRQFRDWVGMVGPWCLPNMVLGGCFAVPSTAAVEVGGFDEAFSTYGFTETTLVARLVAAGLPVIPQLASAALHVEWNPSHHAQAARNERFRAAHRKFFTEFLGGLR